MKRLSAIIISTTMWLVPLAVPWQSSDAQYYGYGYDLYTNDYYGDYGYRPYRPYSYGRNYTPRYSGYYADGLHGNYYTTPWWYR